MILVGTGAARGGEVGGPVPPFESAQFHKNYFKKIKFQKANSKTLNSSVIQSWVANMQRQNFCIFCKFFSKSLAFLSSKNFKCLACIVSEIFGLKKRLQQKSKVNHF